MNWIRIYFLQIIFFLPPFQHGELPQTSSPGLRSFSQNLPRTPFIDHKLKTLVFIFSKIYYNIYRITMTYKSGVLVFALWRRSTRIGRAICLKVYLYLTTTYILLNRIDKLPCWTYAKPILRKRMTVKMIK